MPETAVTNADHTRVDWLDAAKGFGIALIVIGHVFSTQAPSLFYHYLYAFHVPLFFFVAGVTLGFGRDGFSQFVRKKTRTLMLPYGVYALLGYFFYLAGYALTTAMGQQLEQFRYGLWGPLLGVLWGTVGSGNLVNSPLWFLPALFWASLLTHEINERLPSVAARLAAIAILGALGCLLAERVELPMSMGPALIALPFMQAGYMHKAWSGLLNRGVGTWLIVGLAAAVFAASPVNGFSMQSATVIGNPYLFYTFAFAGITLTAALLQMPMLRSRWLSSLGQYSLAIMVIHMLVIKSVQVLLVAGLSLSFNDLTSHAGWGLLVLVIVAAALVPLVWAMENWLPFTLGKRKHPPAHA
jgi:acyltransferase